MVLKKTLLNVLALRKYLIAACLLPLALSCGKDADENPPRKQENTAPVALSESEPSNDTGNNPNTPTPPGTTKPSDRPTTEDLSHLICRTDESDNKRYCFDENTEFPSDTDPEKKVRKCERGVLDQDTCKPLKLTFGKEKSGSFQLLAGDTVRVDAVNATKPGSPAEVINTITFTKTKIEDSWIYKNFAYDFPTKYDKTSMTSLLNKGVIKVNGPIITVEQNDETDPVSIAYYGVEFQTGPMTLERFKQLCTSMSTVEPWKYYPPSSGNTHSCSNWPRSSLAKLYLKCDRNDQHCQLNEATLDYSRIKG